MTRRMTRRGMARRLELLARGLRNGRRELITMMVERWSTGLGVHGETFSIEVTMPRRPSRSRR